MAKTINQITISDLLNNYIFIEGDLGNSSDVYNSKANYFVTFVENSAEESAQSSNGVTKVYDAVRVEPKDVTGTASNDIKKGTVIARLEQNSTPAKSQVKISVRTDINNTYNIPVRPSDSFVAIDVEHFDGEPGIALLQAVSKSAKSFNDIINWNPSLELLDPAQLLASLKAEATSSTISSSQETGKAAKSSSK